MSVDSVREIRTMILLSLPYPPLPVIVRSTDPLELSAQGERAETTSHTLLARCLNAMAEKNDKERNARRMQRQSDVFRHFLFTMADSGFRMEPKDLFGLYCEFTRQHMLTYFEGDELRTDICFGTLDDAPKGSKCHAKMCEYMAGQSVLFQDNPPKNRKHYEGKSYGSLLLMVRDRLGHTMSEEEHAKAVDIMLAKPSESDTGDSGESGDIREDPRTTSDDIREDPRTTSEA